MRSGSWFWRATALLAVGAVFYLGHAISGGRSVGLENEASAQSYARSGHYPYGSEAAIDVARDIVFEQFEADGRAWGAKGRDEEAAEQIGRVASVIMRNYRPFVAPNRREGSRQPVVQPGQAKQPE